MDKKKLVEQIIARLEQELAVLTRAAAAARDAATHEESKAEDQYDTRGLESSYLAGAQAQRVTELKQVIGACRALPVREFGKNDPIAPGALIELELAGKRGHSIVVFLLAQGGGISIPFEGRTVQVITPQAPLGDELIGKRADDTIEVESQNAVREYRVVRVH